MASTISLDFSPAIVKTFATFYRGRTDAWGSVEGRSNKEPVTEQHYKNHLDGGISIGIYPLLDDGTCWFAAVDLDKKDWDMAIKIRQGFADSGIAAHISESKGKGYHITCFAGPEAFIAKDIRRIAYHILDKLKITAEVFPKQDKLDDVIPLGNYINLPCFGPTRSFLDKDKKYIHAEEFLKRIQLNPKSVVDAIITTLPPPVVARIMLAPTPKGEEKKAKKRSSGRREPPCIEMMIKGIPGGGRDVAAFALARHYLDDLYTPEEVLGLLQVWDAKNKPPLNDLRVLETKVRSAMKGYAFGCGSVSGEPLLAGFCVGEHKCEYIQKLTAEKIKQGLIREQSFMETDAYIYEEIYDSGKAAFACYEKSTGKVDMRPKVEYPDLTIVPINGPEITEGCVTLPTGIEEYGDTLSLVAEIRKHILRYVDLQEGPLELSAWYILMSWVYDRLGTLSYLRFLGDTGTGKSRCLDVIGRLAYKPMMMAGAVTPAPIYRMIRRFRGTLILEEADFRDSSEKGEVVTILNSGFEKFRPVIRCVKDNPDQMDVLPIFGPKIFATRYDFTDIALEARCLTFTMEETEREDIPPLLGADFYSSAEHLRNKLLLWRLRNLEKTDQSSVEKIDLGNIEPRLKQIGLPFAVPFKDYPEVLAKFREFIQGYNRNLISDRGDSKNGKVVLSIFKLAKENGKDQVTASMIANFMGDEFKIETTAPGVGRILRSLNIGHSSRKIGGSQGKFLIWKNRLMRKLLRKYIPDPEEYRDLVIESVEPQSTLDTEV